MRFSVAWTAKAEPGGRGCPPPAREALQGYDFPGNTRELENILERAIALSATDEIQADDLQLAPPSFAREPPGPNAKWPLQDYLDRIEREAILEALDQTRFNRTAAAKLLGINKDRMKYLCRKYNL